MNKELLPFELHKNICEAVGCDATATTVIAVKAGIYGIINLYLCENCVCKFEMEHE